MLWETFEFELSILEFEIISKNDTRFLFFFFSFLIIGRLSSRLSGQNFYRLFSYLA